MGSQTEFPMVDLHAHPLLPMYYFRKDPRRRHRNSKLFPYTPFGSHIARPRLKESGVKVLVSCVYAFSRLPHRNCFGSAKAQIELFGKWMSNEAETVAHARTPFEIDSITASGKIAVVLALEGGHHTALDLTHLDYFQKMGVFYMTIVHFTNTPVAECCHFSDFFGERGLRPFGREMITEMNRRGIIVDVAHCSERSFWDVMKHSKVPPIYTHGGARTLCDHHRNLRDEQVEAIARAGGVMGVILYPGFLRKGSFWRSIDDVIRHLEHWLKIAGPEALAIGSDQNGVMVARDLGGYDRMPRLREAIIQAFGEPLAKKILFENSLNYMKRYWGKPA